MKFEFLQAISIFFGATFVGSSNVFSSSSREEESTNAVADGSTSLAPAKWTSVLTGFGPVLMALIMIVMGRVIVGGAGIERVEPAEAAGRSG